jgi:pimeloyl-ACP methyl ester carboxylesterase
VGESSNYRWPPRMPGIAHTVVHMLDALGYDRVDVLGVSLGGVVAQQRAHQAAHRVRRLIRGIPATSRSGQQHLATGCAACIRHVRHSRDPFPRPGAQGT